MDFEGTCSAIKEVKIQGAEAVAKAAAKALVFRHDKAAVKKIISLRPTEPALRNSIKYAISHYGLKEGVKEVIDHFELNHKKINLLGSGIIKSGMTVYTHCHSSTVINILKEAKKQGKKFSVICTETRPLFQGRRTAIELSEAKIPVTLMVDSAARIALKQADIMLLGADAITYTKVYNKIGSELFAEIANKFDVPVYICTNSWKFDPQPYEEIEERPSKEIWPDAPKGIKILNPAFEKINPNLIEAIISELGILDFNSFLAQVKKTYPFIFEK
jgi:ribose 1,5-bisphosphate isomerase